MVFILLSRTASRAIPEYPRYPVIANMDKIPMIVMTTISSTREKPEIPQFILSQYLSFCFERIEKALFGLDCSGYPFEGIVSLAMTGDKLFCVFIYRKSKKVEIRSIVVNSP